jgi:hypothetical protein
MGVVRSEKRSKLQYSLYGSWLDWIDPFPVDEQTGGYGGSTFEAGRVKLISE